MTQIKWTKQAGLAATLFALGTGAYWLEFKHKPQTETAEERTKKPFELKDTPVREVTLNDGAGHSFSVRCTDSTGKLCKPGDNSKWELTQPSKLKADDGNSNALLSSLNNLSVTETIDLKDETPEKRTALLKEYGLDPQTLAQPSIRKVEVTTDKGKHVLYLGLNHPIGDGIFAVGADQTKVFIVPNYFKSNFTHDLTYWRDKKLLTVAAHEIEGFKLSGGKANVSGERKDGLWSLKTTSAETFPGDIENIDSLLTAATYLTAKDFASDNKNDAKAKATLQGTKTVLTLTLQQEKGTAKEMPAPFTLTLFQKGAVKKGNGPASGAGTRLYATVSSLDPLYELEPVSIERLNKELKDLRLVKLITSMERFTIKKLEFSGAAMGASALVLKNQDGKWTVEGEKAEIDSEKVQSTLDKLSGNRIQSFLQGSAIPAGEKDGILMKLSDDKAEKRKLAFWTNGGKLYAHDLLSNRKEVFLLETSLKGDLPWARDFFIKKPGAATKEH